MADVDPTGQVASNLDRQAEVDALLDSIDDVLEPNAEEFVKSFVQESGNGGSQYFALVERLIDATDPGLVHELLKFLLSYVDGEGDRFNWRPADELAIDIVRGVEINFGSDLAEYLNVPFLSKEEFREALEYYAGRHDPEPAEDRVLRATFDRLEQNLRFAVLENDLEHAGVLIKELLAASPHREAKLKREFAFLFDLDAHPSSTLHWIAGVWALLSAGHSSHAVDRRPLIEVTFVPGELEQRIPESNNRRRRPRKLASQLEPADDETPTSSSSIAISPGAKGAVLESSVVSVLKQVFTLSQTTETWLLDKLRKQQAGTQFGMDIQFECTEVNGQAVRCHVECKNYSNAVKLSDVADKLLQTQTYWADKPIDHFIIISPRSSPQNELDLMIQLWNQRATYPFRVQVWSPDNGVDELFAVVPDAYSAIYGHSPPTVQPAKVIQRFLGTLHPHLRISSALINYANDVYGHALDQEEADSFDPLYADSMIARVVDSTGKALGSLDDVLDDWLSKSMPNTLLLLGTFGDGKSFFGYKTTRRLSSLLSDAAGGGRLSVRLALRDLRAAGTPRELLDRRLREFGSNIAEWLQASRHVPMLIVLDGFDEMSGELDPNSVAENLRLVSACIRDFEPAKVLITSRPHFFETRQEDERFFEQLRMPSVVRLTPPPRAVRVSHLSEFAKKNNLYKKLKKIQGLYDPIGLAGKPLFLQMIKATLERLPDDQFDEVVLYETYIDMALHRKPELLEDRLLQVTREATIRNMRSLLERIALTLHEENVNSLDLRTFAFSTNERAASMLWKLSATDRDDKDAVARVGMRSLLTRVPSSDAEVWAVGFFHRSMREYFVAAALANALKARSSSFVKAFGRRPISPVIRNFLVKIVEKDTDVETITRTLEATARGCVKGLNEDLWLGGNAISVLCRTVRKLPASGWQNLNLDGADLTGADLSGIDFRESSLRGVVLNDADLSGASLVDCDLTGARFDETAAVISIGPLSDEAVLVGYADGVVRRWTWERGAEPRSEIIVEDQVDLTDVAAGPGGIMISIANRWLTIWMPPSTSSYTVARQDANNSSGVEWSVLTRFRLRNEYRELQFVEPSIISVLSDVRAMNRAFLDVCDPTLLRVERRINLPYIFSSATSGQFCAFVLSSTVVKLMGPADLSIIAASPISAISLRQLSDSEVLLIVGGQDGSVSLSRVVRGADGLKVASTIVREGVHDGPVTAFGFLSDSQFSSGSSDRSVIVHEIEQDDWRQRLRLRASLSCSGLLYEGVQGSTEYEILDRLVRRG